MQKKTKLTLNKESIRNLTDAETNQVNGGRTTQYVTQLCAFPSQHCPPPLTEECYTMLNCE